MAIRRRSNHGSARAPKRLRLETLENRRLLAADCGPANEADTIEGIPPGSLESLSPSAEVAGSVTAADAGSTRRTAASIGTLDGSRSLRGSLGWGDSTDVIRFELDTASEVQFDLSGFRRNVDLTVLDASGVRLGSSTASGTTPERLAGRLGAGTYYIVASARSFWWTSYDLDLTARAIVPTTIPEAAPEESDRETSPDPVPINDITPLADVADYGSARDWNLNAVGAPEAWAAGYTGQGVTVAVIDTGVDLDHPDLVGQWYVNPGEIPNNGVDDDGNGFVDDVSGYDFVDGDNRPDDVGGHGTHVAGTVAARRDGVGTTGVAPDAKILPIRVLGDNGSGSSHDVAAGIRYAAELGADIINLSLGGGFSSVIQSAIDYAGSLGSLVVAAAGNESANQPSFPARFSGSNESVISVGAYDSQHRQASFSNDVGRSGALQIDAPGVGIWSTYVDGRYARLSGTSMAAPHVAGLAALTISANPDLTSPEIRDLLAGSTLGLASGSDAIGSADARTTVAYAAAGLTTTGNVIASPNPTFADASRGSLVRASSPRNGDAPNADRVAAPIDSIRSAAHPIATDLGSTNTEFQKDAFAAFDRNSANRQSFDADRNNETSSNLPIAVDFLLSRLGDADQEDLFQGEHPHGEIANEIADDLPRRYLDTQAS